MTFRTLAAATATLALVWASPGTAEPLDIAEDLKQCIECHTGSTEIGQKILSAKASWGQSVHALGQRIPIHDSASHEAIGYYWGGSMAVMGNGSSCQVCHTHEGFLNKLEGEYPTPDVTAAEVIAQPSPIGCATCHLVHEETDFSVLRVPSGTPVHNGINATYDKPEGSICVACHSARLMDGRVATFETTTARILNSLKADYTMSSHFGPHYGGEADMLAGANGAEYAGRDYTPVSAHSTEPKATCTGCHMPLRSDMMSHLSTSLGNHSFAITAPLRGSMGANLGGCEGCHDIVQRDLSTYMVPETEGYLIAGELYFQDAKNWELSTGSQTVRLDQPVRPAQQINDIMVKLADPDRGCEGLLATAFDHVTGAEWGMRFSNDANKRCMISGYSRNPLPAATAETDPSARFLKAVWNFVLVSEGDARKGAHNLAYALRLLYDSCVDLNDLVGGGDVAAACNDPARNRP